MKTIINILVFILISNYSFAQYDSILVGAEYRTFLLHLPSDYVEGSEVPLIIAMHGGFGSGPQLENQSQLSVKADEENFIVVYPEGSEGFLNVRTWNAGACCGYSSNNEIDDVSFISQLIDSLSINFSVDTTRVYATGMSNGAMMSYRLACELSHKIAAIAPVAGTMVASNCSPLFQIPIIHFHSFLDSNVPYDGGVGDGFSSHYNPPLDSALNAWATHNNCQLLNDTIQSDSNFTFIKWGNCDCNYEIDLYISEDGGHSWPGGQISLGDPPSTVINANDLMWDFFSNYTLACESALDIAETPEEKQGVKVYPNPTNGSLIIVGEKLNHLTIFNSAGQLFLDMEIHPSDMLNIDLSGETPGYYYLQVSFDNDKVDVIKLLLNDQ